MYALVLAATAAAAPPAQDCAKFFGGAPLVFADQHDGDEKQVTYSKTTMTIHPHGNNQFARRIELVACPAIATVRPSRSLAGPGWWKRR